MDMVSKHTNQVSFGMERYYRKWEEEDIKGLHSFSQISRLYTESNEQGVVLREIGLDKLGKITHRYPSNAHPFGSRGIFDVQTVEPSGGTTNLAKDEFEDLWRRTE